MFRTELLVIGGGAAGIAGAAAAVEKGMKVTVVEPKKHPGGNGVFPRGIFAVDSIIQRHRLIFADVDEVFRKTMLDTHWKTDGRILRALLEKSGDTISWLMKKGVPICDVVHHMPNQTPEVFHITREKENTGLVVMKKLVQFLMDQGAQILTETRAKRLLTDENGAVTGALCTSDSGGELEIRAEKVLVCTGGFSANPDMLARFLPELKTGEAGALRGMPMVGDGIRMAMEAGADLEGHFTMEISAPKLKHNNPISSLILGKPYNVWFNCFGKRFADEGIVYNFPVSANACMRQPQSRVWVVFTQKMLERTLQDGMDIIELIHAKEGAAERFDGEMQKLIEEGTILKCDSIGLEMAEFIGCDPETLRQSAAEYDRFCAAGRDALFAKDRRYLMPLSEGPFYCVAAGTSLLNTHGGIRVDETFHALDKDYRQVRNLFVAGVDFGGVDADVYNLNLSGHGFGFALNSGRIAGETAADDLALSACL